MHGTSLGASAILGVVWNTFKLLERLFLISVLVWAVYWECSLAREWRNGTNIWNAGWYEGEYGMLEYWNSGGCAGLGSLYILTVVVMIDESN